MIVSKKLINDLQNNPSKVGLGIKIKDLVNIIEVANQQYFDEGESFLSDNTFDVLIDILKQRSPNNPLLKKIGADVHEGAEKVLLPYPMKSLDKVKPHTRQLINWLEKFNGPYFISEKLDGLSGLFIIKYEKGNNQLKTQLFKRGDGTRGQEVTHLMNYIKTIPYGNGKVNKLSDLNKFTQKYLKTNGIIVIRGEFIMDIKTFHSKYEKDYPKCRALIAGVTNSKTVPQNIAADVRFVGYQLIKPDAFKMSDQFEFIKDNFYVAQFERVTKLNEDILQPMLLRFKTNSEYEIDGIVLTDDTKFYPTPKDSNPKHSVAFKMLLDEQIKTTKVINVEYNVSKHGVLKPRVEFEQVFIGGNKISFATGFHGKFIKENNIGPGAEIQLVLSGDVIPYIYKVNKGIGKGKWQKPTVDFIWSDSGIELMVKNKNDNAGVRLKILINFFKSLEVDGLGPAIIEKLYNANYDDINKIIALTPDKIAMMEGFQLKSANKIYDAIHKVIDKPIELSLLMSASNVFESGFGVRKLKPVILTYPNILSDVSKYSESDMIQRIIKVEGYSQKTASQLVKHLPAFNKWLKTHSSLIYSVDKKETSVSTKNNGKMKDQFVIFTGVRDTELESKIVKEGGTIVNSVTSNTTLLITKDVSSSSSKIKKAKELGITIISLNDFIEQFK
jgi:DNA ligase (NAD+)